jgi:hypothetical protein
MKVENKLFVANVTTDYKKNTYKIELVFTLPVLSLSYSGARGCDRRQSYSGSGLPFHNVEQAFFNTKNCGTVQVVGNSAIIKGFIPNAYYESLDKPLIESRISLTINKYFYEDIYIPRGHTNRDLTSYSKHEYESHSEGNKI